MHAVCWLKNFAPTSLQITEKFLSFVGEMEILVPQLKATVYGDLALRGHD